MDYSTSVCTYGYFDPLLAWMGYSALLLPVVLVGLLLWRRRGPRDARDVLGSARVLPVNLPRRVLAATGGWAMVLCVGGFLLWLRNFGSERDVLRLTDRV
ncbi:hypothetical protein [Melittangium boletus]|uniref:hypothetical protein n=1 Tax=Melittangium boletus TaxID=83453 RepID=UPI003DA4DDC4